MERVALVFGKSRRKPQGPPADGGFVSGLFGRLSSDFDLFLSDFGTTFSLFSPIFVRTFWTTFKRSIGGPERGREEGRGPRRAVGRVDHGIIDNGHRRVGDRARGVCRVPVVPLEFARDALAGR